MAELVSGRLQPRVDLTPMVDLAFLLITFFMLTTSLNKPYAMDVVMPEKSDTTQTTDFADRRTMTILLGADNKIIWYWGLLDKPIEGPKVIGYGRNGIRTELLDKIKKVAAYKGLNTSKLMVVIRPGSQSNYGNLVDILDEMKTTAIEQYMIGDVMKTEIDLLRAKGI